MPTGKQKDLSHVPPRDGRFGRPYRISNRDRDYLEKQCSNGDGASLVYEMVNVINSMEYALGKALDEIDGRSKHIRTALALGRSLNDLGEFQGQTSAADVAIVRRETAYRLLATVLDETTIAKLRKGERVAPAENPGAEGRP